MRSRFKDPGLWVYGLCSAFISGAVGMTGLMMYDSKEFNLLDQMKKTLIIGCWLGIIGVINYLKKSPLPEIVTTDTEFINKPSDHEKD